MARQGFNIEVESPGGNVYKRKSLDEAKGEGKYVQQKIPFKFEFDETMRPNFGRVTITNITDQQRQEFKKGKKITLRAGWLPEQENNWFVANADIINTNVYVKEQNTYDLDVMFRDTPKQYHQRIVANDWDRGTDVCKVLEDILYDKIGEEYEGQIQCESKKEYRRGKSFYLPIYEALDQVTSDAEVKLFFYNNKYYVIDAKKAFPCSSKVIKKKDIMKGPFPKAGFNQEALLQFESTIKPGHYMRVNSDNVSGKFRVYSGKHTSLDGTKLRSKVNFKK